MLETDDWKLALRKLNTQEQILFVESYLPDAWEYLHDISKVELPKFDENDNMVSCGMSCGPQDVKEEEQ